MPTSRLAWPSILDRAAQIVESYDTGVTLRQLFYRLVSEQMIPNKQTAYDTLSSRTAKARRQGWFPSLVDRGRGIYRPVTFDGPQDAKDWLRDAYRLDRTEGQGTNLYIGVEKDALAALLEDWFDSLGVPILVLKGYASQTYVDEVMRDVFRTRGDRPSILLYAGDLDPSGEDIPRDFNDRTRCFDRVVKVALTWDQVEAHGLPPSMGKATDTRAAAFKAKHGRLVQVELDALPPDALRTLYRDALDAYWSEDAYQRVLDREGRDRAAL
jgi:hypothetical protein